MENRSNYVIVGSVALAMALGVLLMILWLARFSGGAKHDYDILFRQSINGLVVGSQVAFKGVVVGKTTQIQILPDKPEFVRVRIAINEDVPILEGTTAAVGGVGFTGPSQIQLSGSMSGHKPITGPSPYGVPLIPARQDGLGELLATAPQVLANVTKLTERLNDVLNDENRAALGGILRNTDVATAALAKSAPDLAAAIAETRTTVTAATATLQRFEALASSGQTLVDSELRPLATDLRRAAARAEATLAKVEAISASAQPGVEILSTQTIPETTQLIRELRETTARLGAIAAKLDEDPAGALLGGRRLPEYQPPKGTEK
jgi:phospholipid/cholesterol/gamma-HCH transport system substrate-binding protein